MDVKEAVDKKTTTEKKAVEKEGTKTKSSPEDNKKTDTSAEAKKSFEKKEMDPDDSFQAVELMVPAKELSKDKELVSKLGPPKWQVYTYVNENGKCTSKHHKSENEAKDYFNTELSNNPKSNKVILA